MPHQQTEQDTCKPWPHCSLHNPALQTVERKAIDILNGYFRYTLSLDIDRDIPEAAKDVDNLVRQEVLAALGRVKEADDKEGAYIIRTQRLIGALELEIARWTK